MPERIPITFEIIYYVTVWLLGFSSSVSRALRDDHDNTVFNIVSSGLFGGFLSFAIVAIWFTRADFGNVPCLGVSCLVGLAGKDIHRHLLLNLIKLVEKVSAKDATK